MQGGGEVSATAIGRGIAVAHGGQGDIHLRYRLSIDLDSFEAFAREHDIRKSAMDGFFRTLEEKAVAPEEAAARLQEIATTHIRTRADLRALVPHGGSKIVRDRAEEALEDGRLDDAEGLLRELERQAGENAEAARVAAEQAMRSKAHAAALRGNLRQMQLDYAGAAAAFGEALAALPEGDGAAADYLTRLAAAERGAGRFAAAAAAAGAALAADPLTNSASVARAWRERALAFRESGQYEAADVAFAAGARALEGVESEGELLSDLLVSQASLLVDQGRLGEAGDAYRRLDPSDRLALGHYFHGLGRLRLEEGDWRGAQAALAQAVAVRTEALSGRRPDTIRSLTQLAYAHKCAGLNRDAARLYEEAYERCVSVLGVDHPDLVTILDSLGGFYLAEGDHGRARTALERAIALAEASLGPGHPDLGQLEQSRPGPSEGR